ncbi:hypothetical protein GC194_11795 [bacterium]|nr:hypothetical protein [bacterium]
MVVLSISGCNDNRYEVDLTGIEVNIPLTRYEEKLAALSDEGFESDFNALIQQYPLMSEVFVEQIIGAGRVANPNYRVLKRALLDSNFKEIIADVDKQFADLGTMEADINRAFAHVAYYFPLDTLPQHCYTLVTGMRVPGLTYEGILGVSLDWYMGRGYKYYHTQVFPKYMQRRMQQEYIVPQLVEGYFRDKYPLEKNTDGTLLSEMIYWGKQLEFTKMMIPEVPDSIIIEYTTENMKWCKDNEWMIYKHFVDRNLWYSTDQQEIFRYVSDGPYTVAPDVPSESAPRMGWFTGWQIVRNYLKHEKGNPAELLFNNNNYQDIFKKARYKP